MMQVILEQEKWGHSMLVGRVSGLRSWMLELRHGFVSEAVKRDITGRREIEPLFEHQPQVYWIFAECGQIIRLHSSIDVATCTYF